MRAYPEDLRREYGDEMVRSFRDLCRREIRGRGASGLALLWVRVLLELFFTAPKERSAMLARNAYLPARPAVVTRWGGLSALLGGVMGTMANYLGVAVSLRLSFVVLLFSASLTALGLFGLYGALAAASERSGATASAPGRLAAAGALLAAGSVVSLLALGGFGALGLVWGWAAVPMHAATATAFCCWFAGLLLLGTAVLRTRLWEERLRALPLAVLALVPVSLFLPAWTSFANPLITGLPFLGSALLGWWLLKSAGDEGLPVSGDAGTSTPAVARRAAGMVPPSAGGARSARQGTSAAEAAKEKELLRALHNRGALTVAGAALETSLSVDEADRMLSALAAKGHLDVRVERGRLLYSLWSADE